MPTPDSSTPGVWSGFGGVHQGCNGKVLAIEHLANGDLVVGGQFSACGNIVANSIARWDGSEWHAFEDAHGNGVAGEVFALRVVGTDLYVGGAYFRQIGSSFVGNLTRWNG
jgi:hypothetical protein